jgi:amino acid adenylation domain-containing protein
MSPALFSTLFEARVAEFPAAPALVCGTDRLSYAELDAEAERWAGELVRRGVGPEARVALALPRGTELVIAVLTVLKAGGAVVPIDLDYPRERIAAILEDADPLVVLTSAGAAWPSDGPEVLVVDDPEVRARHATAQTGPGARAARHKAEPANAAYVIYTSGSTGRPKGVVVTHRGIESLVAAQTQASAAGPGSRVLQLASPGFDAFVFELALSLLTGATLVIAAGDARLPGRELVELIRREQVTHAAIVPSVLTALDPEDLPSLTHLFVGAEACPLALAERWSAGREMYNGYGPTEATVIATVSEPLVPGHAPEIGRPIVNTHVYVLDDFLQEVPVGIVGELYIGGLGVARGYLNRTQETSSRFVADFRGPEGERMYRTGDLARWDAAGNLYFAGRADEQVKIRGFRIELGEIESVLAAAPGVLAAVVLAREDRPGVKQIVAYLVPQDAARGVDLDALGARAAEMLPEYMVPHAYHVLERLPLTPNGKLDRTALPQPARPAAAGGREVSSELERRLRALFADVLRLEPADVGFDDEFFHLGGDSVLASQFVYRAEQTLALPCTLRDLFEAPTVQLLAARFAPALTASAVR